MEKLSREEAARQAPDGWVVLVDGLHTRVETDAFVTGVALAQHIAAAARQLDHDPELTLRADAVDVRLSTAEVHGVTAVDLRLAAAISDVVAQAGLTLSGRAASRLELALDTPDVDEVGGFWAAVLGGALESGAGFGAEVSDPTGALPTVWFQASDREEPRQRWHPDVWVDPREVQGRIDAALAAGGELVSDAEAPAFWVLADRQGNKVCLCTWQSRG